MPEYTFMDGVLRDRALSAAETPLGGTLTVAVVDLGLDEGDEPEADYAVSRAPDGAAPGELRFITARGRWPDGDAEPSLT
ncbi:hypothetical protein [Cellulomonas soli]|uniref:Uncharacterized protein n=1 Tax=Cellulomonas soli TaxID=931535 RepID=A0A512P9C1_9CELL|nr:hypothetical protein [Cellulomonas soli]NYI60296.1 hypothetical protein [Cellulomonas soli]GEP67807.1 hypothetical protein CSO01_05220 [Cellulomonas soli]